MSEKNTNVPSVVVARWFQSGAADSTGCPTQSTVLEA